MPPQFNVPRNSGQMDQNAKRAFKNDISRVRSKDRSADQRSTESSAANSGAPNSVYLACSPLTRELSDLSGSYANGSGGTKDTVPGHIYDHASYKGPWRQAYSLSQVPPNQKENWAFKASNSDPTILVSQNDVVEIVDSFQLKAGIEKEGHSRTPLVVLLMDATSQSYELMQVWVDRSTDSVRDLVQCLRQSIPEKWRQDYDGVFQVRGNRFTQLIHILRLLKYDVQPHEILIAKPRSMTAKVTISCATSAIRHLTSIGVINTDGSDRRVFRPKSEESPLLLSKAALDRVYAPNGSFSHHHAVQYLTFAPPFDSNVKPVTITAERDCANSSLGSQSAATGKGSSDASHPKGSVLSALGLSSRTNSVAQAPPADCSEEKNNQAAPRGGFAANVTPGNAQTSPEGSPQGKRRTFGGIVSKLNCCRTKERLLAAQPLNPVAILTEEQEQQWSSFDIRPITEDNNSTAGQSIVSMSAPLLASTQHKMQTSEYLCEF